MPDASILLSKEEITDLNEYVDSCKSLYELFRNQTFSNIQSEYAISEDSSKRIYDMEDNVIDTLTYQNLDEVFELLEIDKSAVKTKREKGYMGGETFLEFIKEAFKEIKTRIADVVEQKTQLEDLMADINEAKQSTIDYVNSPEFMEKKQEHYKNQLESLKVERLSEEDKKKVEAELRFIDSMESCAFLYERLDKLGVEEVHRIMDHFFKNALGEYTMRKFRAACKKFHINWDIYRHFLNLEETFLPEEYHPLNNVFLFVCIRFISYADDRNSNENDYVHRLVNNLVFLYTHKFPTKEREENFLETVKKVCRFFLPHKEEFVIRNLTYKNHPERIKRIELIKDREKAELTRTLKLKGIEVDTNASVEELKETLQKFEQEKEENARLEAEAAKEAEAEETEEEIPADEAQEETEEPKVLEVDKEVLPDVPEFNLEDYSIQQVCEETNEKDPKAPVNFVVEQINPE